MQINQEAVVYMSITLTISEVRAGGGEEREETNDKDIGTLINTQQRG